MSATATTPMLGTSLESARDDERPDGITNADEHHLSDTQPRNAVVGAQIAADEQRDPAEPDGDAGEACRPQRGAVAEQERDEDAGEWHAGNQETRSDPTGDVARRS